MATNYGKKKTNNRESKRHKQSLNSKRAQKQQRMKNKGPIIK